MNKQKFPYPAHYIKKLMDNTHTHQQQHIASIITIIMPDFIITWSTGGCVFQQKGFLARMNSAVWGLFLRRPKKYASAKFHLHKTSVSK